MSDNKDHNSDSDSDGAPEEFTQETVSLIRRQKNVSDSKEEEAKHPRKKKLKSSGIETVIYKEIPPPECLKTGLDFLKNRKAQVPRSSSILTNSSQALRLVTGASSAKKQPRRK
ncbi:hypothetical protein Rs2_46096 [Raphanus sativus]|nr:hypothetical protein Rs2_50020 [Raphanus sativus]KAJ4872241.1 hypothetical protein Rs2_46096 [Raphanus sativus]